jgi:hypothetical protein
MIIRVWRPLMLRELTHLVRRVRRFWVLSIVVGTSVALVVAIATGRLPRLGATTAPRSPSVGHSATESTSDRAISVRQLDVTVVNAATPGPGSQSRELKVQYAFPTVDETEVDPQALVYVQFSRPVAVLSALRQQSGAPVLSFTPPLSGTGKWLTSALYTFKPDRSLDGDTTYNVEVPLVSVTCPAHRSDNPTAGRLKP